jgi:23S rRNA (adenine2503-C2)-methyltransferase
MAIVRSVLGTGKESVATWLEQQNEPSYRARQIYQWLFHRGVDGFDEMTSLSKQLRGDLSREFQVWTTRVAAHQQAEDGTEKLLLELADHQTIECVLLPDRRRRSICISTQVGCAMGCVFCASGLRGVERNLRTHEIVEQMLRLKRLLPADERLSHIVVMGMGEPLANLDQLLPALDVARSQDGLGIGVRRITISTVGLPAAIRRLAKHHVHYHLAISLHAPNDELRNRLVPVNQKTGIHDLLEAADEYFDVSARRLTYEYVLLAGVNDQPEHARQLVRLLRGRAALLNIIPYNPVEGLPYKTPSQHGEQRFRALLEDGGLTVEFRQRRGDTIDAACGQLRRSADAER